MARVVLTHRHAAQECRIAFAAWRGFDSPLRHAAAEASCAAADGEHTIWWRVEAPDADGALAQRTEASPVREVSIP